MSKDPIKDVKNTPLAARDSLRGVKNLPMPTEEMAKSITDSVYQQHVDSSDDENQID